MAVKVGIPKGLLYYQYFPMWKRFFQLMGAEVVVSAPTTKAVLASGIARTYGDTCLPVKAYCGHVVSLIGQCDYVFVPALCSLEKNAYNCSKFLGLPDIVRAVVPEVKVLDVEVNLSKGRREFYASLYALARLFTWNPLKVKQAAEEAWEAYEEHQRRMSLYGCSPVEALEEPFNPPPSQGGGKATVAIVGHPYVLYDQYINHRLIDRLGSMGVRVVTPEMAPEGELDKATEALVGQPYWTYEDEVVGAGGYYLKGSVDGVISVVAFGCGPDSTMLEMVRRYAQKVSSKPFMSLILDEHTAEAGLLTRLEAFMDMLLRRKRQQGLI